MTQHNPETALTRSPWAGGYATLVAAYLVFFVAIGGVVTWLALAGPLSPPASAPISAQQQATASSQPEAAAAPTESSDNETVSLGKNAAPSSQPPAAETITPPETAAETPPKPANDHGVESYDPALVADSPYGKLPIIGPNGKTAWQTYARPFNPTDDGPRLAIVIEDLGLNKDRTEQVIDKLPPEVTLAFSPYAENLQDWADKARTAGHEILLGIPMEPISYPDDDPGPDALLTTLSPQQNVDRLQQILGRVTGYVGVVNAMGSKFTASTTALTPVLQDISHRGILFVDSSATRLSVAAKLARTLDIPRALNNRYIDNDITTQAIDDQLEELEKVAQGYGAAVGFARAYPISIERLAAWIPTLKSKGILIAPITAVANRQPIR